MDRFIHWLLPPRCVFCYEYLSEAKVICDVCHAELPWHFNPYDEQRITLFHYKKPIDRLITELKFHQKIIYARFFATCFIEKIKQLRHEKLPDLLIPVPLHRKRLQARGFNQALEIAKPIAKQFGIPLDFQCIERVKNTKPQTELPAKKRLKNVKNAFSIKTPISAKHIAILDDVMTTGSTVNEMAKLLMANGVEKVEIWCCALPERTNGDQNK